MKKVYIAIVAGLVALPSISFAYESLFDIIDEILDLIETAFIPIIIGFAVLVFLWGVLKFIKAAGDPKGREEGQQFMLWGIIGLAVMVSVWGLVAIVTGTFGIEAGLPSIDPSNY